MFIFHNTQVSIMGYTQNDKKYTLFTKKYIIRVILKTKLVLHFFLLKSYNICTKCETFTQN